MARRARAGGRWHRHAGARRLWGAGGGGIPASPPAPGPAGPAAAAPASPAPGAPWQARTQRQELNAGGASRAGAQRGLPKLPSGISHDESPCLLQLRVFKQENGSVLFQPSQFLYRNLATVCELLGELCCPLCASACTWERSTESLVGFFG